MTLGRLPCRTLAAALAVGSALGLGCGPAPAPTCLEERLDPGRQGLGTVVAARDGEGVRVRGFTGAAPPGSEVAVVAEGERASAIADERGRFDISLDIDSSTVGLAVGGEPLTLRVRKLEDALACVPGAPIAVGTTPNDLALGRCGADLVALVATSTDGALEGASLTGEKVPPPASFAPVAGRPANPWGVALHEGGALAAVTLFGQHTVALVDACAGQTLHVAEALDDEGRPLVVDVAPPVALASPQDADGDGTLETEVSRMIVRHPEGVAFAGDRLLVSYTNLLEVGPPARFGPGVVVAFALEQDELRPAGHTVLPFRNPQAITLDDEGRPWVSCSGVLERGTASFEAASDGGLVRLDPLTLEARHTLDLGRFAPATPAITQGGIVVGSLLEGQLAHLPPGATSLRDGKLLATGADGAESIFEVTALPGGLALAAGFTTDALVVVDVDEGALHPWPFERPLALGPGGDIFRGLKAVARAPDEALPATAPDLAALFALSYEVVPLRLWQVMGP